MNICTGVPCQNTELGIYQSVVGTVCGLMLLAQRTTNLWMNSYWAKTTPWTFEHFFCNKGLPVFVILKIKNLLTLHWQFLNEVHWTLKPRRSQQIKLCNIAIIYYSVKRVRCVSTIGFAPDCSLKKPYNKYLFNLFCLIRTISSWPIRMEKTLVRS